MARCNNGNIAESKFFCTHCGKEGIPIPRQGGRLRELGHLKMLYCIFCKDTYNHVEIGSNRGYTLEDFMQDFTEGKFSDKQKYERGK